MGGKGGCCGTICTLALMGMILSFFSSTIGIITLCVVGIVVISAIAYYIVNKKKNVEEQVEIEKEQNIDKRAKEKKTDVKPITIEKPKINENISGGNANKGLDNKEKRREFIKWLKGEDKLQNKIATHPKKKKTMKNDSLKPRVDNKISNPQIEMRKEPNPIVEFFKRRTKKQIFIGVGVIVLIVATIITIVEINKITVPDIKGLAPKEAEERLIDVGFKKGNITFTCSSEKIRNYDSSKYIVDYQEPKAEERVFGSELISVKLEDKNKCKENLKKIENITLDKAMKKVSEFNKNTSTKFMAIVYDADSKDITSDIQGMNDQDRAKIMVLSVGDISLNDNTIEFKTDTLANIQKKKAEEEAKKAKEEAEKEAEKKKAAEEEAKKKAEEEAAKKLQEEVEKKEEAKRNACSESDAWLAFELAGKENFPFGFKCHWIMELYNSEQQEDGSWKIKVGVTITNAFGAKYDAVAEGTVMPNGTTVKDFNVY